MRCFQQYKGRTIFCSYLEHKIPVCIDGYILTIQLGKTTSETRAQNKMKN